MRNVAMFLTGTALIGLSATLLVLPEFALSHAQLSDPQQQAAPAPAATEPIPAFHSQPPVGALPPTMDPSLYTDKLIVNAYTVAARIKKVLYQQPCYCYCDRHSGHGSLLDCYVSRHGSNCDTCLKEVFYSYEQTRRGKTPAQIRQGIIRGDWQKIDLTKYDKALPPTSTK